MSHQSVTVQPSPGSVTAGSTTSGIELIVTVQVAVPEQVSLRVVVRYVSGELGGCRGWVRCVRLALLLFGLGFEGDGVAGHGLG
jgi:hypothetical protein